MLVYAHIIWKHSILLLIKFTALNAALLITAMIPGWNASSKFESELKSYASHVFLALEQSCASIEDLKCSITSYNKTKFIEGTVINANENTYIYLLKNIFDQDHTPQESITFPDESIINKIDISRVTSLDPNIRIVLSIEPQAILNSIVPKYLQTFYSFEINKAFQPLRMVTPNILLITSSSLLSVLLMTLWKISTAFISQKKQMLKRAHDFHANESPKNAHLSFLQLYSAYMIEDLHRVFKTINSESNRTSALQNPNMVTIQESLGTIITFGTLQRNRGKIDLFQNLQTAIHCFFTEILAKKIHISHPKLDSALYVQQTELKNLLILCSIMRLFIVNLPPKSEVFINVEEDKEQTLKLIFYDNMPLPWKDFNGEGSELNNLAHLFLDYEKIIYACVDEEIKAEYEHRDSGNYFILQYSLSRTTGNIIQGNFR